MGKTNTGDLDFKISASSSPAKTKPAKKAKVVLPTTSNDENDMEENSPIPTTSRKTNPPKTTVKEIASINVKRIDDKKKSKKRSTSDKEIDEDEEIEENDNTVDILPERKKMRRKQIDANDGEILSPKSSKDVVVNNEVVAKGKRNGKTYELNLELNISLDANVIVNVKRKNKASP